MVFGKVRSGFSSRTVKQSFSTITDVTVITVERKHLQTIIVPVSLQSLFFSYLNWGEVLRDYFWLYLYSRVTTGGS